MHCLKICGNLSSKRPPAKCIFSGAASCKNERTMQTSDFCLEICLSKFFNRSYYHFYFFSLWTKSLMYNKILKYYQPNFFFFFFFFFLWGAAKSSFFSDMPKKKEVLWFKIYGLYFSLYTRSYRKNHEKYPQPNCIFFFGGKVLQN